MKAFRIITGPILAIIFVVVFIYASLVTNYFLEEIEANYFLGNISGVVEENVETQKSEEVIINSVSGLSVEVDYNGEKNVIFEKNSNEKLPIASLTKLMTAIIAIDNYDLSQIKLITEKTDYYIPMKTDIMAGSAITISNLLNMTLIASSNRAAYSLAEVMGQERFVELMNEKANDLGLINTFFVEPTGLSDENISTASDLANLTEYILKNYPRVLWTTTTKELNIEGVGVISNTNEIIEEIPIIEMGKTGFTDSAKGCLIMVVKNIQENSHIINIILGSEDRFLEMKKIIKI